MTSRLSAAATPDARVVRPRAASSPSRVSGGYEVTLWCSPGGYVDGLGSTLSEAAENARILASLG